MSGNESASQHYSNRAQVHGDTYHHDAHDLVIPSDTLGHDQEEKYVNEDVVEEKTRGSVNEDVGILNHPSRTMSCAGLTADSRHTSRAVRASRRGAKSTTNPPAACRRPTSAAAADEVILSGKEKCMKVEMEASLAPALVPESVGTGSKLAAAQSISCERRGKSGPRSTRMGSYGSGITGGRNSKRLRRTVQVEAVCDVAAGDDVVPEEEGTDIKLELGVSSPSSRVPSSMSHLQGRQLDDRTRARSFCG